MDIKIIFLLLMYLISLSAMAADTCNNDSLHEEHLQLKNKLDSLKRVKSELDKTVYELEAALRDYGAVRNQLRSRKIISLENRTKELPVLIQTLDMEVSDLQRDFEALQRQILQYKNSINDLNSIKEEVVAELLGKYGNYVEMSFSVMSEARIEEIIDACREYKADQRIKALSDRAEKYLQYKNIYDKATEVCSSAFNKHDVMVSQEEISSVTRVNDLQRTELDNLQHQLEVFEEGIQVFKEIIVRLNKRRDATEVYYARDFMDDQEFILYGLTEKIQTCIAPVTYLKKEYEAYLEIIKADPMQHPAIEQVLLSL